MSRIAFVAANTFEFDSRTLRAAQTLAEDGHDVLVVALAAPQLPTEETLPGRVRVVRPALDRRLASALRPLPERLRAALVRPLGIGPEDLVTPPRRTGFRERVVGPLRRGLEILAYRRRVGPWADAVVAAAPDADVVAAKALVALPVAAAAARRTGGRYVYDVADVHVESGRLAHMPRFVKRSVARRERAWVRAASALLASTPAVADEVARRYGVPAPAAILNVRPRWRPDERMPRTGRLRDAAAIGPEVPVALYQGAFREEQGLEELLAALDDARVAATELVAVFLGFGRLADRLAAAAAARPGRIVVLPPVPSDELLDWTCDADLAFVGAPPVTLNQRLTTPNKLFESLMAGVPVLVAGDTFSARLVAEAGVGLVVDPWTVDGLAIALAGFAALGPDALTALRERARAAALERYCWERQREPLLAAYRAALERSQ